MRRVLRLSHLEDMHESDAGVCASFVGSLWILRVLVVAIRDQAERRLDEVGAHHVKVVFYRDWLTGSAQTVAGRQDLKCLRENASNLRATQVQ